LCDVSATLSGVANQIPAVASPGAFRGVNPGAATGQFVVVPGSPEGLDLEPEKIYVLSYPPSDLQPVAGILTVSEGNAASHVQLLARNLGIPNAVLTDESLRELVPLTGTRVFYAVSPGGAVVLKRAEAMTSDERALVEAPASGASDEKVTVPV